MQSRPIFVSISNCRIVQSSTLFLPRKPSSLHARSITRQRFSTSLRRLENKGDDAPKDESSLRIQRQRVYPKSIHPPRLFGQVVIVTGSSSGLGRAVALQAASHGTKLIICADLNRAPRPDDAEDDKTPTHELIQKFYGTSKAAFIATNITKSASVEEMVMQAHGKGKRIDVLVNCAGIGSASGSPNLHDLSEAAWDKVIDVNLKGTFLTNKHVLRRMVNQELRVLPSVSTSPHDFPGLGYQKTSEGHHPLARRGTIINVSSMLSTIALPRGTAAYCASKGGVLNLTKQLALDYAQHRININALCPGFTKTAMTQGNWSNEKTNDEMINATPMGGWGRAEDVARMAISLASEDACWMTGAQVVVDGGYSAQ